MIPLTESVFSYNQSMSNATASHDMFSCGPIDVVSGNKPSLDDGGSL